MTQVFISYSRTDMDFVQRLAMDLQRAGLDVWWDLSDIQGSDVWERKIEEGLRTSQYFIVVLSPASLESRWVRREYLSADNKGIKIIPLKLKPYDDVPLTLRDIQPIDAIGRTYEDTLSDVLKILTGSDTVDQKSVALKMGEQTIEEVASNKTDEIDLVGTIFLLAFFLFVSFQLFDDSSDFVKILAALSGFATGYFLFRRRKMPRGNLFKIAVILFLVVYDLKLLNDMIGWDFPGVDIIAGIAAVVLAGAVIASFPVSKMHALYATLFLSVYIFFVSIHIGLNALGEYPAWPYIPTIAISVITGVLIWMEL